MALERRKEPGEAWETVEASGGGGSLPDWWTVDSTPGAESALLGASFGIGLTDAEVDASGPGLFVQSVDIPYSEGGYPGSVCINAGLTIDDGDYVFKIVSLDPLYPSFEGDIMLLDSNGGCKFFLGEAAANWGPRDVSGTAGFLMYGDGRLILQPTAGLFATGLPTADPVVAGQVWNDTGILKVSTG